MNSNEMKRENQSPHKINDIRTEYSIYDLFERAHTRIRIVNIGIVAEQAPHKAQNEQSSTNYNKNGRARECESEMKHLMLYGPLVL